MHPKESYENDEKNAKIARVNPGSAFTFSAVYGAAGGTLDCVLATAVRGRVPLVLLNLLEAGPTLNAAFTNVSNIS